MICADFVMGTNLDNLRIVGDASHAVACAREAHRETVFSSTNYRHHRRMNLDTWLGASSTAAFNLGAEGRTSVTRLTELFKLRANSPPRIDLQGADANPILSWQGSWVDHRQCEYLFERVEVAIPMQERMSLAKAERRD